MEKRWRDFLALALDRVCVLRGQIVHGAATRGSSLNRAVLRQCSQVLEGLLPPILYLAIEHGAHDDWPLLCSPKLPRWSSAFRRPRASWSMVRRKRLATNPRSGSWLTHFSLTTHAPVVMAFEGGVREKR